MAEFVQGFMEAMSLLSASAMGESAFSVDCVTRTGSVRPVQAWGLISALAPVMLLGGIALLWFCIHTSDDKCRRRGLRRLPKTQVSNQSSEAAQAAQPSTSRPVSVLEVHWPVTNLVTLILGHPTICKGAFQLLSCRTIGGRSFLEADLDVSCRSSEYAAWALGVAMPSILLAGCGIPGYYFVRMWRLQPSLAEHRAVYGFLFSGYSEECWWYC